MDPALEELIAEGGEDEVEAIIRLSSSQPLPDHVRLVSRFGSIATCRLPRVRIVETWAAAPVLSLKAKRPFEPGDDTLQKEDERRPRRRSDLALRPTDRRRPHGLSTTGRGVVVGVVDWGFDFAHPNLRHADGATRILALWDQTFASDEPPEPYGYGQVYRADDIDRALQMREPYEALGYHPGIADRARRGAHGTHVTDIAAGCGRFEGSPLGLAPEANLLLVHLASRGTGGLANLGDSVTLLEALDWIRREAGDRPWVVNMSVGRHGGPHTGLTLVEQAIDELLVEAPGRCIVQSTGNYFAARTHACGQLRPGEARTLRWTVDRADHTPNELEIWYAKADALGITLIPPEGGDAMTVPLGGDAPIEAGGKRIGHFYHRARDPSNGDHHVDIFLYTNAPAGEWHIRLAGEDVVDGRYNCWVERDSACRTCQSRLHPEDADTRTTTGTICNGRRNIAVGAYDAHDPDHPLSRFSSSGPTVDGRVKPDLLAPGVKILAARSTPPDATAPRPGLVRQSGTSMAAPHVTGAVANLFEAAGRPLAIQETRRLLLSSTRPADLAPEDQLRGGSGYLDVIAAVEAVRDLVRRNPHSPSPIPEHPAYPAAIETAGEAPEQETLSMASEEFEPVAMTNEIEYGDAESLIESLFDDEDVSGVLRDARGEAVGVPMLFDALAGYGGAASRRHFEQYFEVVAAPGEAWTEALRAGDLVLERALGEGGLAFAERISEGQLSEWLEDLRNDGPGDVPPDSRLRSGRRRMRRRLAHNRLIARPRRRLPADDDDELGLPESDEESGFIERANPPPMGVPPGDPALFAPDPPPGSFWPVVSRNPHARRVNYQAADGSFVGGNRALRFLASRSNGSRNHVGIDLLADFGDPVVAIADGRIVNFYGFCCGKTKTTYALLIDHGNVVVNYGEVAPDSLRSNGLSKGSTVTAGQVIGSIGRNPGGSSMLHFETFRPGTTANVRWSRGAPRPAAVYNPTSYLLWLLEHGRIGTADGGTVVPTLVLPPPGTQRQFVSPRFQGDPVLLDVLNGRRLLRSGSKGDAVRKVQQALLDLGYPLPRSGADGDFGGETKAAVRRFQSDQKRSDLAMDVDGVVGRQTMGKLDLAVAARSVPPSIPTVPVPVPVPVPPPAPVTPVTDWTTVSREQRMLHVMELLVRTYRYPVNGAAGLVGNLDAESGVLPNRIEGSSAATPMRARNFDNEVTDFTPDEVMNRDRNARVGPRLPGIGLAQWTSAGRRAGLFRHAVGGRVLGSAILNDMDAQVDYLVSELAASFVGVDRVLRNPGVMLNDASDEVVYNFEIPGSVLTDTSPRRKRPRTDPAVVRVFEQRRARSRAALAAYRSAHPEGATEADAEHDDPDPLEVDLGCDADATWGDTDLSVGEGSAHPWVEAGPDKQLRAARFQGDPVLHEVLNGRRMLRHSSRGEHVRKVQQALLHLGYALPRFGADGQYGTETAAAVRSFQADQRRLDGSVVVDGIVGPQTMDKLDQAVATPAAAARMRRNVSALSATELAALALAFNELRRRTIYHDFVRDHAASMANAHRQPAFLPWHRQFVVNLESELAAMTPGITLPYWDWASDPGVNAAGAPSWNAAMVTLMGGNGTGPNDFVTSGPFAGWTALDTAGNDTGMPLQRSFGTASWARALPTNAEVTAALAVTPYDQSPWDDGAFTGGFRNELEGWARANSLHNVVHGWVGGSMLPATSPNDPCFFLHHCFVDKIWADWQAAHPSLGYLPTTQVPRPGRAPAWGVNDDVPVFRVGTSSPVTFKASDTLDLNNLRDHKGTTGIQVRYA